jgi:hypothetical protein
MPLPWMPSKVVSSTKGKGIGTDRDEDTALPYDSKAKLRQIDEMRRLILLDHPSPAMVCKQ